MHPCLDQVQLFLHSTDDKKKKNVTKTPDSVTSRIRCFVYIAFLWDMKDFVLFMCFLFLCSCSLEQIGRGSRSDADGVWKGPSYGKHMSGTLYAVAVDYPDGYDWKADPATTRQTDIYGAFCTSVRYKWLVRDSFSLYSALGAGISLGFPIPLPYIAPIGIKFGKGKVYGIVEANVSAASTFGMAGIGIRL